MERVHLKPGPQTRRPRPETRTGRDCLFCRHSDPNFAMRATHYRLVTSNEDDSATAHMTENGYVQHRFSRSEDSPRRDDWIMAACRVNPISGSASWFG
jgi:hypothetical protein